MKKRIDTLIILIGTIGCLMTSCGSVSKEIEEQNKKDSATFGNGGEDTIEMKDARAEDRVKFRRAAASQIAENEKHLSDINASSDSVRLKRWKMATAENNSLKEQLKSFNETLDTNWVVFTNKIDSGLKVVSASIKALEVH